MANGASIIIGLVFILVLSILAYFFSPKGENQTYALLFAFSFAVPSSSSSPPVSKRPAKRRSARGETRVR
ncbi:MAG: hypothetical protein LQ348_002452 [Seirophora lacunosa]|nr:MAG: hypothetical protein LQ348_002452 [Seirophora lacunosa]